MVYDQGRLFVGEGSTKQGEIHVFKVANLEAPSKLEVELLMVFRGHKYGIRQLAIAGDLVVSVGDDNDNGLLVWETVSPRMLSANLMKKSQILGTVFVPDPPLGKIQFLTYGTNCHLKLWSVDIERSEKYPTVYSVKVEADKPVPQLEGKKLLIGQAADFVFSKVIIEK